MAKPTRADRFDEPVLSHIRTDFVRVVATDSVGEALARVQCSQPEGRIVYFYVVDEDNRLQGVIPTRRLLLSSPETPVAEIMERKVIVLPSTATLLDACEFFTIHRLLALPVVDGEHRMLGVVDVELYTEEISDVAARRESDDVFQLIGVRLAQVCQASIPAAFRRRFPWLLCNIGGGLACAFLAAMYEQILANVVVLAMFIPIVLALAESVSIQSLTLTLQAHEAGRFQWRKLVSALRREAMISVLLGLSCGSLVGLIAWIWQGRGLVGLCMVVSIAFSVTAAALFGLAVPTALRAIQRDPKTASGPIVLAMTDVATLISYLGLAAALLG
jgi:magnesium transporter